MRSLRSIFTALFLALLCLTGFSPAFSQSILITGKVTDAETGEGMPFVNVYFKGSAIGTTTDFDGLFTLKHEFVGDTLVASYVGYLTREKLIDRTARQQVINFQLSAQVTTLMTVTVTPKGYENPAWEILRNVVRNKPFYDKQSLDAYQYESYTKTEMAIDNISEKFRSKRVISKIVAVLDSIDKIAGEDGAPILPVFISETLSEYYYNKNPQRTRENILKTKVSGVGVTDGTTVAQILGSTFQDYNFYKNWLHILEKDFVSPIADSWKAYYDYELQKEMKLIGGVKCYQIDFVPKRKEDLAFTGSMWITDSTYALRQIDVRIGKEANLNFIDKIKIQQELAEVVEGGVWLPSKTRVLIDIGEVKDDWAGLLAKFYVSNRNFVVNQPKENKFFQQAMVVDEQALIPGSDAFWNRHRHDPLTETEKNVYHMIDTLKQLPAIRSWVEIANIILVSGYKKVGKIDLGTYTYLYAFNDVEGHRFRLGYRTNADFSRRIVFQGYGAYGTEDQRFKYKTEVFGILSRKRWTTIGAGRMFDVEQVALYNPDVENTPLFTAFSRFGTLRRPFLNHMNHFWFQTELRPGLTQTLRLRNRRFDPLYRFQFFVPGEDGRRMSAFTTTEVQAEYRFAPGELFIQNDNERISAGTTDIPIITFRYAYGIDGLMGSDFGYHKLFASLQHNFLLGGLGRTEYILSGGYIPSLAPYPVLETHMGNQSYFLNSNSYNLMNLFEFASDQYVSLRIRHRFEGLLFNRLPLIRKFNWRLFASADILYGSARQENINLIPLTDEAGNPIPAFRSLGRQPYIEVGYGIENIFRILRVDFLHRLTYRHENAQLFGIKISTQFRL